MDNATLALAAAEAASSLGCLADEWRYLLADTVVSAHQQHFQQQATEHAPAVRCISPCVLAPLDVAFHEASRAEKGVPSTPRNYYSVVAEQFI